MRRKISSREWAMIIALAAVGLFWLYSKGGGDSARATGTAGLDELDISSAPTVDMAAIHRRGVPYDGEGRSLFKYYVPPRPKPKATPPPPRPPQERKPPPVPQPTQPVKRPSGPARIPPPKPNFEYLGYFGHKDHKIGTFEDKDDIMLAQVGDVVRDQFVIREFKYEGVILGFVDKRFEGQTTELQQLNIDKKGR